MHALLDAGADVHKQDKDGRIALTFAARHGPAEAMRLLVARGATLPPSAALIINTPLGKITRHDDGMIRSESYQANIPCLTTMSAASAAVEAIRARQAGHATVRSLQDYFDGSTTAPMPQDSDQLGEVVR